MAISEFRISYDDFELGEIIEPDEFDINNAEIVERINKIIGVLNQITDSIGGVGGDIISIAPIAPFIPDKLQQFLQDVITQLRNFGPSGGSTFIGAAPVEGVSGNTVYEQIVSLRQLLEGLDDFYSGEISRIDEDINDLEDKTNVTNSEVAEIDGRVSITESEIRDLYEIKADSSDVYTKVESDNSYALLEDDIRDINATLDNKTDVAGNHEGTWQGIDVDDLSGVLGISDAIISTSEPINATEGVLWYNPSNHEYRIFYKGKFRISGNSMNAKKIESRVTLSDSVNSFEHGIEDFDKDVDVIMVYKNSTYVKEGVEYVVSSDSKSIEKVTGSWDDGTVFDVVVLINSAVKNSQVFQDNTLKIAKLEKELQDYKSIMASINVNQEAKQTASGYGIVSLPKNAANGQVSAVVKGLTATNLIKNGNFANGTTDWEEISDFTATTSNNTCNFTVIGKNGRIQQLIVANVGDKIYRQVTVKASSPLVGIGDAGIPLAFHSGNGNFERLSSVRTETIANRYLSIIDTRASEWTEIQVKNAIVINLTQLFGAGNEPTVEQCDKIFANYFDGTKSTIGAMRLKSVGKNLFDRSKAVEHHIFAWTAGGLFAEQKSIASDFIRTIPGQQYYINYKSQVMFYDANKTYLGCLQPNGVTIAPTIGAMINSFTVPNIGHIKYMRLGVRTNTNGDIDLTKVDNIQLEKGSVATDYVSYKETSAYVIAKDDEGNIEELRSLPNGVRDEIRVSGGKMIQKNNQIIIDGNSNLSSVITQTNTYYTTLRIYDALGGGSGSRALTATNDDGEFPILGGFSADRRGVVLKSSENTAFILIEREKVDNMTGATLSEKYRAYLNKYPITLTYQLAEPIITPIQISGTLLSNPSGTITIDKGVADVGIYDSGISIADEELPIGEVEEVSKIDFETGLETTLDVSECVISEDRKSFTHPDLIGGDIVFFIYQHDLESTNAELEVEFYDSRYVLKDSVTDKFYKIEKSVTDGQLVETLVEV